MKKLAILALLSLALLMLFVTLGCEGDQGPQGPAGDPGEDGPDAVIPTPDDRIISLAIFNGTQKDHNGAHLISLTFDSTAIPSGSVLVANRVAGPPVIDGIDEGTDAWGLKVSNIDLETQALADNYIYEARVRAAYDDKNMYFQVRWTEEEEDDFVKGKNSKHLGWVYDGDNFIIEPVYEDRMALMFIAATSAASFWESQGCRDGCHVGDGEPDYMRSISPSVLIDVWQWGSARSNGLGIALDRVLTSLRFVEDAGVPPIFQNLFVQQRIEDEVTYFDSIPIYMHRYQADDPEYTAADPMLEDFVAPYQDDGWTTNSTLPGWIFQSPSEGNDLIKCKGVYSNGTWTVEFSRPRITDDRFDADF
jgi:hypothetical protein